MTIKDDRKMLEDMIESSKPSLSETEVPMNDPVELQAKPIFNMIFSRTKRSCLRKARSMINRATGLMLSSEMINENLYLRNKMQIDTISLSGLLYQLEINEMMQETLMEEVRSGSAQPRMFEVFGNLTKTIGEINKQLLQTVEAIKITYRDIKNDIKNKEGEIRSIGHGESGLLRNNKGLISMGTKDLIKEANKLRNINLKENMQNDPNIQDIEEIV